MAFKLPEMDERMNKILKELKGLNLEEIREKLRTL
jgi:hypothetical protein